MKKTINNVISIDKVMENMENKVLDNVSQATIDLSVKDEVQQEQSVEFSHQDLIKLTKQAIDNIVESDPMLSGLPSDVTLEELKAQIAVAQGQAITLYLDRGDLPKLGIVVPPHNTTVLDLKRAVKRHTNLSLKRENVRKKISWKHVWKKYDLCFLDVRLSNNNENIKAYGITNKAELHYVKKRREKNRLGRGH